MANTPTPSTTAISLHLAAYAGQLHPDVVREYAGYAHGVDLARRDMAVIATSPDLTPAGRAKNLDKRRADASKALDPLRATIERTRQRLVDVERSAVPPRPATQDQSTIAREREIRDRLTGKESLTVLQYAIDAVTSGDEDLLHAIEGAPRAFPLLTPRDAQTLRQVRLEKSTAAPLLDVEATLAYAEHQLTHLPSLWRDCTPNQRQALGRVLFPDRVQFDGVFCQTATWAFGFNGLE